MKTQFKSEALNTLLAELGHSEKSHIKGVMFPVQTRLYPISYGYVEALTQRASTSRNKIMNQLIEIGLDTLLNVLPEDLAKELNSRAAEVIQQSQKGALSEESEE